MTAQLGLFDAPRARRSDPGSSHRAAAEAAKFAASQAAEVLRLVLAHPGSTTKQLAAWRVLDRYQIARRAPELEAGGYVERRAETPGEELRLWPTERARRWARGV